MGDRSSGFLLCGVLLVACAPPLPVSEDLGEEALDCPIGLALQGGRALSRPAVINVYWGRYWVTPLAADNAFLPAGTVPWRAWDDAWSRLASSPVFWAPILEYGVGTGSWGGSATIEEDDDRQARLPEEAIHAALERAMSTGRLADRSGAIYIVYLPPGLTAENDYIGFGDWPVAAHHGFHRRAVGAPIVYAVIEAWNATMGGPSLAGSHEITEAATDPDFTGWWDGETGAEVADICIGFEMLLSDGDSPATDFFYKVHGVWSQRSCECAGVELGSTAEKANDAGKRGLSGGRDTGAAGGRGAG